VALFRRRRDADAQPASEDETGFVVPDDLPRDSLFQQPIVVDQLGVKDVEELEDGQVRVVFRAVVRDAVGKRCPDLAVFAEVAGPERTAAGQGTTDLMGAILFRMVGPRGTYAIRIDDVAAGALELDREASTLELTVEA
jgi:hypothetical protein